MTVEQIIEGVLKREGSKFTDDPKDSGGPTRWGITQAVLSRWRGMKVSAADVANLSDTEARAIYLVRYVDGPGFRTIMSISSAIAEELVDTGVNTGPARATEMLQRALNALNRQGRDYPDVKVDGECGPSTIAALKAYLAFRKAAGITVLLRALNALQGEFYISLAERRPKDEEFLYGWLLNRVV